MRAFLMTGTRLKLVLPLAAAIAIAQPAAAADVAVAPNATPLPQYVQDFGYGDDYYGYYNSYYHPACPKHYYYACHYYPTGVPYCGCWPGGELQYPLPY